MDIKLKTCQATGDKFHVLDAELSAVLARVSEVTADVRRCQIVVPEGAHLAERTLSMLATAEHNLRAAQLDTRRAHAFLRRAGERMDIGFQCPQGASADRAPVAKRA
jgi:hypothetical protein